MDFRRINDLRKYLSTVESCCNASKHSKEKLKEDGSIDALMSSNAHAPEMRRTTNNFDGLVIISISKK